MLFEIKTTVPFSEAADCLLNNASLKKGRLNLDIFYWNYEDLHQWPGFKKKQRGYISFLQYEYYVCSSVGFFVSNKHQNKELIGTEYFVETQWLVKI